MSNHDDSLMDKVKNAFGMGDDEHEDQHVGDRGVDTDPLDTSERTEGWAGVDEALGGTDNRPAGPDYGGGDPITGTNDDAFGTTAAPLGGGASGTYTGVGESLDPDRQGTAETGWTRGEAASGRPAFDDETAMDNPLNPRRDDPI